VTAPGTIPCGRCGAPIPIESGRCSRCGRAVPGGPVSDLATTPGAPLIRGLPERRRVSSFDFLPQAFLDDDAERRTRSAAQHGALIRAQRQRRLYATLVGAALTIFPFAAAALVFMPVKRDVLFLALPDGLLGALCGRVLTRFRGGLVKSVLLFAPAFVLIASLKVQLGYPIVHHPAAGAVIGLAAVLALLVAGFLGVALDEGITD
jgi:hypothetical protein